MIDYNERKFVASASMEFMKELIRNSDFFKSQIDTGLKKIEDVFNLPDDDDDDDERKIENIKEELFNSAWTFSDTIAECAVTMADELASALNRRRESWETDFYLTDETNGEKQIADAIERVADVLDPEK